MSQKNLYLGYVTDHNTDIITIQIWNRSFGLKDTFIRLDVTLRTDVQKYHTYSDKSETRRGSKEVYCGLPVYMTSDMDIKLEEFPMMIWLVVIHRWFYCCGHRKMFFLDFYAFDGPE